MTKNNDFTDVSKTIEQFHPEKPHIITEKEAEFVSELLELKTRNALELQNIRNAVVMLYGKMVDSTSAKGDAQKAMELMDAMSAVCSVVDNMMFRRTGSV